MQVIAVLFHFMLFFYLDDKMSARNHEKSIPMYHATFDTYRRNSIIESCIDSIDEIDARANIGTFCGERYG